MGSRPPSNRRIDPVTTEGESLRVKQNVWPIRRSLENKTNVQLAAYISGYVDGEGCFSVSLSPRHTLKTGWEVRPSFSVSQNADRAAFLYEIQRYFDCGTIRPDRSDKTIKYEVRSLNNLVERVIPHFQQFPLRSEKQDAFERFAQVCQLMADKKHLQSEDMKLIGRLATEINGGKRKYLF